MSHSGLLSPPSYRIILSRKAACYRLFMLKSVRCTLVTSRHRVIFFRYDLENCVTQTDTGGSVVMYVVPYSCHIDAMCMPARRTSGHTYGPASMHCSRRLGVRALRIQHGAALQRMVIMAAHDALCSTCICRGNLVSVERRQENLLQNLCITNSNYVACALLIIR